MSGHPNMPLLSHETKQVSSLHAGELVGFCPERGSVCEDAAGVIEKQVFNNDPFNVDLAISDCTFNSTGLCAAALRKIAYMNGGAE